MSMDDAILADLTPPQREAVTHTDGPLLVVAGAGSGKTRVITRRVAYLALRAAPAHQILAVTFTNKAAGEMRERIERLAGARGAWVSTFHSLCAVMLRISADSIGLSRNFTIYDRDDQLKAVREVMSRLEIDTKMLQPGGVLSAISNAKSEMKSPARFAELATDYGQERVAKVYEGYQKLLDANAALDFDDLLMRTASLLRQDPAFLERWQQRFRFILIDEYQDTNQAQYLIARSLAAQHQNICATGDPDQSIYGWRGADIRNILHFQRDYPNARVVKLEQNYRSTKSILRGAERLIIRNAQRIERGLWTDNPEGVAIAFRLAESAEEEALIVALEMKSQVAAGRRWGDFAVFYRTNAQSRSFEEAMVRASVPHRLVGATQFYGRQEVRDVLAYLRICINESDSLSLERILNVPVRGIGDRTIDRLKAWAIEQGVTLRAALARVGEIGDVGTRAQNAVKAFSDLLDGFRLAEKRPVADFCGRVLVESGYGAWLDEAENLERRENVGEFLAKATAFDAQNPDGDLADFLQEVSLVSDIDNYDRSADAATLMTLHAAKGLEFPVVFLTGMEEGLLPHANSSESDEKLEEERRLCYVGITRAKQELIITAARERATYQGGWGKEPSRFLAEMGTETFDEAGRRSLASFGASDPWADEEPSPSLARKPRRDADSEAASERRRAPSRAAGLGAPASAKGFAVGDRVRHPSFGEGRIVGLQKSDKMTLATVAMSGGGKRVFALEFANLAKIKG